jgi:hypothetical protein
MEALAKTGGVSSTALEERLSTCEVSDTYRRPRAVFLTDNIEK